jgi:hypothetical protein
MLTRSYPPAVSHACNIHDNKTQGYVALLNATFLHPSAVQEAPWEGHRPFARDLATLSAVLITLSSIRLCCRDHIMFGVRFTQRA